MSRDDAPDRAKPLCAVFGVNGSSLLARYGTAIWYGRYYLPVVPWNGERRPATVRMGREVVATVDVQIGLKTAAISSVSTEAQPVNYRNRTLLQSCIL